VSRGSPRTAAERRLRAAAIIAGFALFALLAVSNSAGYRYGASDQAFYLPAIARARDAALFPRDRVLLDSQARLTAVDDLLASAGPGGPNGGLTGDLPVVVLSAYVAGLLLLYASAFAFTRALQWSTWTGAALAAALTLRHGISRAGVNTLEGYFHPRLIVFAAGILALAWLARGRTWRALALVFAAGALHPTTALWFLIWIGVAAFVADRRARVPLAALAAVGAAVALWALAYPLAGRLVRMDWAWLAALEGKDYLFPNRWPVYAWITNLAYPLLIGGLAYVRYREGRLTPAERGLVAGALALLAVFLLSIPFNIARVALVIQLQIARVFWMLDFLATALLIAWLTGRRWSRAPLVAAALVFVAAARGIYIMTVEFPERPLVQVRLPHDEWRDAMQWAASTPVGTHWLAHPGHAHLYQSSVRIAGGRDVFHEAVKDAAVAMYARPIAERVVERSAAIADFDALDASHARALASRYELDYLITEAGGLALPVAYSNARFFIYRLR
jgi:hypothetical protein